MKTDAIDLDTLPDDPQGTESLDGQNDAALKGLGIFQLPDYDVEPYLANGALVSLLDNLRIPHEGIWAVYP
jgi:DNA-binding transcriptional LysR family regulator